MHIKSAFEDYCSETCTAEEQLACMPCMILMTIVRPQVCEGLPAGDYAIKQAGPEDVEVTQILPQHSPW